MPRARLRAAFRFLAAGFSLCLAANAAHAEGRIRLAQQFGIAYLILDVVKDQKLIEKHGKQEGLDIKVDWARLSGATAMNDALLSGSLDVVSAGVPPALMVWDRTLGKQNVRLVAALGALPNYLVTTNPAIKTLDDLSGKDRIAVPAAGVGYQSRVLQIESARRWGKDKFDKLDAITVSLPHPDAAAALISGGLAVDTHFASAPYYYQELAGNPKVHKIISSYDILGGPATFNVLYATQKFHDENPKTYKAFLGALAEAADWIDKHKDQAADTFIRVENSRLDPGLVRKIVADPENHFTIVPQQTIVYANGLYKLGVLKHEAKSWKDYFFADAYKLPGS